MCRFFLGVFVPRRLNVIIVPDEGASPRRYSLSVFWLKFWGFVGVIAVIGIVIGASSWGFLARKSLDYNRITLDNERLLVENKRIVRVAQQVDQSRKILSQIVRSLGGHLDIGRPLANGDSIYLEDVFSEGMLAPKPQEPLKVHNVNNTSRKQISSYGMPTHVPIKGFISQEYFVDHLFPQRNHRGIDFAGKTGSPISAAADGRVIFEGWTPSFGNFILLSHAEGYLTFYGHNQINLKRIGEHVKREEPIALLGNSGYSSAPHLHFETWKDGVALNPLELMPHVKEMSE